ncbi:MAG: hypothetical protein ACRDI2_03745 [Chloroflexota bacterium]
MTSFPSPNHTSRDRTSDIGRLASTAWWLWGVCLAGVVLAEALIALGSPYLGLALHFALLVALSICAAFATGEQQLWPLFLLFAPLLRLISLAQPPHLPAEPPAIAWSVLNGLALLVALAAAAYLLRVVQRGAGVRIRSVPALLAIGLICLPLAVVVIGAAAQLGAGRVPIGLALDGFATVALLLLLVQRELAVAAGPRRRPLARGLALAITPLLVAFGGIVASRVAALL